MLVVLATTGCSRDKSVETGATPARYPVAFSFTASVKGQPLVFNTATYTNDLGENYNIRTFRYYISNISLSNSANGNSATAEGEYFLIDAGKEESTHITTQFPAGTYNKLRFLVGVDSTRNVSGAQTGALDVANGMFWSWNSGYVMAKLEGSSPVAPPPTNEFTYHIGGFRVVESTLRWIEFTLPPGSEITVGPSSSAELVVNADVNHWFTGVHDLPISAVGFVHSPGDLAMKYADNYAQMFTLIHSANP